MSQDRFDDNFTMPDWDDMDLSWLDYLEPETPSAPQPAPPRPGRDPVQTRIEPTRREMSSGRRDAAPAHREPSNQGRQAPTQSRPATAQSWQPAPQNWQPAPSRRDPSQLHREPTQTRRTPAQSRQPAPQARQPMPPRQGAPAGPGGQVRPGGQAPRRDGKVPQAPRPAYKPRRRRRSSVPLILLIIVLVGGMTYAGWQLSSIFLNYRRDRSAYNDLAAHAISTLAVPGEEDGPTDPDDPQQQVHSVSEVPISVDWDYLRSINPNIVGWLYCPGTVVSYPVVQSSDHEYYLSHSFDGQANVSGTLFADRNSVPGITQSNYIIYGHNMKDHSMFGSFSNYVNKSYYDENPIMYYLTPDTDYRVELVCAHIAEATIDNFPTYFGSLDDYHGYLTRISSSAFWVNYDLLTTTHQLLTMSTCTSGSGYTDPRFLLHGMLIPLSR